MIEIGNNLTIVLLALIVTAGVVGYRYAKRPARNTAPGKTAGPTTNADTEAIRRVNAELTALVADLKRDGSKP